MTYPYQRSNFWDTVAQQRALGRRLSPGQTQAALTGERAGELQAYYDQSDRNRMRQLQEQQLASAEGAQGSLEDYRNRQLEAQTGLSQQTLDLQRQGQAADQGFRTQQAQAADASARNQAILGYTGLGLGALNYLGGGNSSWQVDANGRIVPRQSVGGRMYDSVRDWFRPNEQAVSNIPQIDYGNFGGYSGDFGSDFGQNFDFGSAGYEYNIPDFDWGSFFTDISGT